jgi:hypothetical protein
MTKPGTLSAALVATKGAAKPATAAPSPPMAAKPARKAQEAQAGYYKALTFKLDRARYESLKKAGLVFDKSSQDILVEALDGYLAKNC